MKLYELSTKTVIDFPIPDNAIITSWIMANGFWVVYSYSCGPVCYNCESSRSIDGKCAYCGSDMTDEPIACHHPCSECAPESGDCSLCPVVNNGRIFNNEIEEA